ncbi:hypothetical protein QFZ94_000820 [Paraburkholderia sp. JPY465]
MIVYKAANGTIWTRPATVFFELVEQDGVKVRRFAPLDEFNNEADASRSD